MHKKKFVYPISCMHSGVWGCYIWYQSQSDNTQAYFGLNMKYERMNMFKTNWHNTFCGCMAMTNEGTELSKWASRIEGGKQRG